MMKDCFSFLSLHSCSLLCRRPDDDIAANAYRLRAVMPESSACLFAAHYCVSHSWRSGANEDFSEDLRRHCARPYVNGSMQGIECALPVSSIVSSESVQVHHHDIEVNLNGMLPELHDQRLALEQEIASLKEKLTHEIKLREALKGGLQRSPGNLPKIPGYVPAKTRELLFEVAVLEEEVIFLEKHAVYLQQELQDEINPESSSSMSLSGEKETVSASKKPVSDIAIPEAEVSEPTTPNVPVSPLLTPFVTPEWRPSALSSPTHDGSMSLSSPSAFVLPLSMTSSPHGEESYGVPNHGEEAERVPPQVLTRKRVIRRGSSSSESLPADVSDRKPSRKKPSHKKSQSLPCLIKKTDVECDPNCAKPSSVKKEAEKDVYERLSAPKNGGHARSLVHTSAPANSDKPGNAALRRSASGKDVQSKYLTRTPQRPAALLNEKVNKCGKRPTSRKEHPGRSPPLASPQLETKAVPYFRRSSSNREAETECSLTSSPSPVFEDKAIASIKLIVSSMSPAGSPQLKFHNCSNSSPTPNAEQGNQDRLVTPFKLPPTGEKENLKMLSLSDERRRTHDLVITRTLPPIKLNMVSDKTPSPFKNAAQQRLTGMNNFSENAKLYAKAKLSMSPTKQGFKVRPVQVQKSSSKVGDSEQYASKGEKKFDLLHHKSESDTVDYDDKDDKVGMACAPIADASWLSDDLARLFGTVCSKIRRHSSSSDPATNKMVAKPPMSLLGGSQRVSSFGRSQSFDIRSQGGLQLLEEFCSDEMDVLDSYDARKHRTANSGPHRHYYKAIKLPLEQKLKT
ncbi:hypothetical protein M758_9G090700 [Ceratodon purpureus]|nr:hypothetical protein M758_9G090700 [Ceratodon purpureus]